MTLIVYLLLITQIILVITEPVDEGTDVGTIKEQNGKKIVLNPGKFPYMVHLEFRRYSKDKDTNQVIRHISNCGGTLIKPDVVLTAAHCVGIHKEIKPIIVAWLGILDTVLDKGKGQEIYVRGYTVHKAFVQAKPKLNLQSVNDIALLFLVHPAILDGKYVKLANLPTYGFSVEGKRGWIIGWGRQSNEPQTSMLQKAVVRGVSASECQKYYTLTKIPANVICILSDDRKKICTSGDSGGPFIVQNTVVGVTSFYAIDHENKNEKTGLYGCDATRAAVYSYVTKYVFWIEDNIKSGPQTILRNSVSTIRPPSQKRDQTKKPPHKSKL